MIGRWHLPEHGTRITSVDADRMSDGYVAVNLTVNQQNRNAGPPHRIFRRNLLHVESILPMSTHKCDFHKRPQENPPHPRSEMKRLPHAVVRNLTKIGEWRLGHHSTETRTRIKRFQQLRRPHRLPQPVDAMRLDLRLHEVHPLSNIVAFEKAVRSERASARTMSPRIRQKDGITVPQQHDRISGHSQTVVAQPVQQKYRVIIGLQRMNQPTLK